MWTWRRDRSISWKDRLTNEEVLGRVGEKRKDIIKGRKRNWLGHCLRKTQGNVMTETLEGLVNGERNRTRRRNEMI